MATGYQHLLYTVDAGVATLTLNRPDKLNALHGALASELVAALGQAAAAGAVRAVVVTGAGRGFSAGGDIAYMSDLMARGDAAALGALVEAGAEVVRLVRACPKPVLAAVNGAAAGGGMGLALACDLRLASTEASFSQAFVRIGMHPDWGSLALLPRLIGVGRALDLMLTGRPVKADEALQIGLVNRLVEPPRLLAEAQGLASALAAGPPLALAAIKRNVHDSPGLTVEEALARELEVQLRLFRSRDAAEGMAAFGAKRPPRYTGE